MKANEFVKKFGLDLAKLDVQAFESGFIKREDIVEHYGFDILDDLKRLVESHDLVTSYNGLHGAKNTLKLLISSIEIGLYHGIDGVNAELEIPRLKQAIADVESCMESGK